jgi:hypothetical protein
LKLFRSSSAASIKAFDTGIDTAANEERNSFKVSFLNENFYDRMVKTVNYKNIIQHLEQIVSM